ncbi:phenylacetic acid degradation protein PaaY [Janthinobacterium sp. 17J80-10]|uniref:phenylacetic acid degradation protein PaaY n=1 Tax=Janthinobacterium sp. 17J80-10 TaxID=2497863 RepID=UPI001005522B|nr:phenylacetic acid degradation protein PaaY [Janthinobacterium sp. 17J80-10]QAU34220.1 phenylacetic acid degradation protein PaaY [Janthinobacterium sp. 17J80-10]
MLKVYAIDGVTPVVHPSAYVHPSAVLIGDVVIGPRCYIGPLASLRGDFGRIIINEGANIQDTCVLHGFQECDTVVDVDGHIGHGAVLHGCRIERDALVGMNAIVMDDAVIGESSIVGAGAFVKAGMIIPARSLVVGAPAKIVRNLREDEITWKRLGTLQYHELVTRSLSSMREVMPLTEVEPNRKRVQTATLNKPKVRGA